MKRVVAELMLAIAAFGVAMSTGIVATAQAEPAGYSSQDDTFFRLLATPDEDDGFVSPH